MVLGYLPHLMEDDRLFALNFPAIMISLRANIEVYDSLLAVNVPL